MPVDQKAIRTITFALDASGHPIGAAINERPLKPTHCFLHARLLVVIPVYPTGQIGHNRTQIIDLDEPESDAEPLLSESEFSTQLSQRQTPALATTM